MFGNEFAEEGSMTIMRLALGFLFAAAGSWLIGCHDDDDGLNDTGRPCQTTDDCYFGIDQDLIEGDVVCMDRVEDGYCTHYCDGDENCCSVAGECETDLPEVCAPFESTGESYCFISCEGVEDEGNFCQIYAHPEFLCRSTGGGSDNRKVCVPN
jgi:hypothetical protein